MARQQLRRYIWLIDTISSSNGITYEEIKRKWDSTSLNDEGRILLPKRTFFDHLNAIREEFDIEITCDRTDNTYRIDDEFDEYGSIKRTLIDSLILNSALRENPGMSNHIVLSDLFHQNCLPILLQAIKESRAIKFKFTEDYSPLREDYISKGMAVEDANSKYPDYSCVLQFETYGLYFCGSWFAVGRCIEDGQIYIYALHAISDIEYLDSHYCIPADFDVKRYMTEFNPLKADQEYSEGKLYQDSSIVFELERDCPRF